MRMSWNGRHAVAALLAFPLALGIGLASAQDADMQARMDEAEKRYEEAFVAGNIDTLMSMFAEDAIYMPALGGTYEGAEAIREYFEKGSGPEALDVRSTHMKPAGDMIFDIGTFTMILPQEAGGGSLEGEYVALVEETDQGFRIHRLVSFPARKPMGSGQ